MLIGLGALLCVAIAAQLPALADDCGGIPCKCYNCAPDEPTSRDRDDVPPSPPAEDDGPSAEEIAAQRLKALSDRLNGVLNDLRTYDVPNVSDLFTAPVPGSLEQLGLRVDRLYVEAASFSRKRNWQFEDNEKTLNDRAATITTLSAEIARMQASVATGPERLKDAEVLRDAKVAKADAEEYVAHVFSGNAHSVEQDFLTARGNSLWTIWELLPADKKGAFAEAMHHADGFPAYALQPPHEAPVVAPAGVSPVAATGVARDMVGMTPRAQPINGSIEDKLSAFKDVKDVLAYLTPLIAAQEERLSALGPQVVDLKKSHEALWNDVHSLDSPIEQAAAMADEAEKRFLAAQINEKISAENMLRLAGAAVVWAHVRNEVVVPAIESVLESNGLLGGVKGVELLDRIRKSPQDFIPKVGPLKDLPRLIETGEKVLGVEQNMESFALAATEANAEAGTAQSDPLVEHLFSRLNEQGLGIMRTASEAMDGPFGRIAQTLMQRAPKE